MPKLILTEKATMLIKQARLRVSRTSSRNASRDNVLSELSFGFWTSFTSKRYETTLWTPRLRHAFPNMAPQRRSLVSAKLEKARTLRNRIAHHESIFDHDLEQDFDGIVDVIFWMSKDAASWAVAQSRVPALLKNKPGIES